MIDKWIAQASETELREAMARVMKLIAHPEYDIPEGAIISIGTNGGSQNKPYSERFYTRTDTGEYARVDADDAPFTWPEVIDMDDPACDRLIVHTDGYYLHTTDIAAAIDGTAR